MKLEKNLSNIFDNKITILIPTFNNIDYLKICLNSIKKNSEFKHEIRLHINDGSDGTLKYAKDNNFFYTHSDENIGLCTAINKISSNITNKYLLYAHDDMYFCPQWDLHLINEIKTFKDDNFFLSATLIEPNSGHIKFDCGDNFKNFNENMLLNNYKIKNFYDYQGSHYAPHLVSTRLWNKVGGFSEEFNPGFASDPDFNMKLWNEGVRIFKGINNFKVYHFVSVASKKINFTSLKKMNTRKQASKIFLLKWGITIKFFKKFYLKTNSKFTAPLSKPNSNIFFLINYLITKVYYVYVKIFYNNLFK